MSSFYNVGERKIRAGVYKRYENVGSSELPGAVVGVFAIAITSKYGPLDTVTAITREDLAKFKAMYGTGGTADAVNALFAGGATKVFVHRLGTGGEKATVTLKDGSDSDGVTLTTKYETDMALNVTVKEKLGTTATKQLLVYDGTTLVETIDFAAGSTESTDLVDAITKNSVYLDATKKADGVLSAVANAELTGGTAPTVTTESYSKAFEAFEAFTWNMLVVDTVDTAVHALVKAYIDRIYQEGALGVVALGEPTTVDFETRKAHAKAFNDEKIIYLGSGYEDASGNKVDGYLAIATQAGIIGSLESNESATHTVIPGAVNTIESLKNAQYEEAIKSGMLLLAPNAEGQVWFDSGVNTLITLAKEQDEGWKKIRRTATRFEMFDRIDRALAPLIGKVNCDNIGVGDAVIKGQAVLDAMVGEGKLQEGAVFAEDATQKRGSDFAHFTIVADDLDSLEKIYLTYQFRFSAE